MGQILTMRAAPHIERESTSNHPFLEIMKEFDLDGVANPCVCFEAQRSVHPAALILDDEGYLQESPNLPFSIPDELNRFIKSVNQLVPPEWGEQYLDPDNVDFGELPMIDGLLRSPYAHPLTRGIDGNRLAYILTARGEDGYPPTPQQELDHVEMQFFIASFLIYRMRNSIDERERKQAAKMALHVFVPLMKVYEVHELVAELEDSSFQILDPKGYTEAFHLWHKYIGERKGKKRIEALRVRIKDIMVKRADRINKYLNGTGINAEDFDIILRQKSLLSFYQKYRDGRSFQKDAFAASILVNDAQKKWEWMQNPENKQKTKLFLETAITPLLSREKGISIVYEGDTFDNPRRYNPNYWVIDTVVEGLETHPIELRITTKTRYDLNIRDHPWYTMIVKSVHQALLTEDKGVSQDDVYYFGDLARYQLLRCLGLKHDIPQIPELQPGTIRVKRLLQEILPQRKVLATRRKATKLLYLSDTPDGDQRKGLNGAFGPTAAIRKAQGRSVTSILTQFAEAINPSIVIQGQVGFQITQGAKTFRLTPKGEGVYRMRVKQDGRWVQGPQVGDLNLADFDTIEILVKRDDEFISLVTVGDIMDELGALQDEVESDRRIARRYSPKYNELAELRFELQELNGMKAMLHLPLDHEHNLGLTPAERNEHRAALTDRHHEIKRRIVAMVEAYDLCRGTDRIDMRNPDSRRRIRNIAKELGPTGYRPGSHIAGWFTNKLAHYGDITAIEAVVFGEEKRFNGEQATLSWLSMADLVYDWAEKGSSEAQECLQKMRDITHKYLITDPEVPLITSDKERSRLVATDKKDSLGMKAYLRARQLIRELDWAKSGQNILIGNLKAREEKEEVRTIIADVINLDQIEEEARVVAEVSKSRPFNVSRLRTVSDQLELSLELAKSDNLIRLSWLKGVPPDVAKEIDRAKVKKVITQFPELIYSAWEPELLPEDDTTSTTIRHGDKGEKKNITTQFNPNVIEKIRALNKELAELLHPIWLGVNK